MKTSSRQTMTEAIARWAAGNPSIRRAWLYGNGKVNVALELDPAGDSEETLVGWMAHAGLWQSQLQKRIAMPVELEWLDPDVRSSALDEAKQLVYERSAD